MHREEVRHDATLVANAADGAGGAQHPAGATADSARAGATETATRQSVRKSVISMLVAAAVLLVFNSADLRSWARGLPGNTVTDVLVESADRWHGIMQRIGFATAMEVVQDAVAEFREQPWPDADDIPIDKAEASRDG